MFWIYKGKPENFHKTGIHICKVVIGLSILFLLIAITTIIPPIYAQLSVLHKLLVALVLISSASNVLYLSEKWRD